MAGAGSSGTDNLKPGNHFTNLAENPEALQLPERMQAKLRQFQRKVWLVKICEGLLAAIFGLLLSWMAVFVLDRLFDTPAWVRGLILLVGAIGPGLWFPLVLHRWVWKSRQLEQVARLLRRSMPRFGDHLLGIIELVQSEGDRGRSLALCRAALDQVDQETQDRDFRQAVPDPRHRRWALIAGVPALAGLVLMLVVPSVLVTRYAPAPTP